VPPNAEWFRQVLGSVPGLGVAVLDADLRIVEVEGERLLGRRSDLVGRLLADVVERERLAEVLPRYRAALAGEPQSCEIEADGRTYAVQIAPLADGGAGCVMSARDVTEERRLDREAAALRGALERGRREAEELFHQAFATSPIGMALIDREGRLSAASPALCAFLGRSEADLRAATLESLLVADDAAVIVRAVAALLRGETTAATHEVRFGHADDGVAHGLISISSVRDDDGTVRRVLAQVQDVGERRRYEERIAWLAEHDPLTGLANRRCFDRHVAEHLAQTARYGPRGAILVVDVDHFKHVNDSLGHGAGDRLLVAVARVLERRLRETDVVARIGGDEFAALLPWADEAEARHVALALTRAVRERTAFSEDGQRLTTTVSVGVALVAGSDAVGAQDLLVAADLALYAAKDAGRDTYEVDRPEARHRERLRRRISYIDRIRGALAGEGFALFAQPIVDVASGRTEQYELLLRLVDGDDGPVAPGAFLPVAERYDLMRQIDRHVVRRAIEFAAERGGEGAPAIAVNVSGRTVGDARLLQRIEADVRRTGVDPRRLVFEITETAAVADIERARHFAERLRELGCRVALDDFGSGFGSFYYLKHLPFDQLKIDGEFIANAQESRTDQLVIRALVDVALGLGKTTIAERVESAPALEHVRAAGVTLAQGFHIGAPRPAAEAWPL
jgi:diguanylate cyclase (GGDEF)-like protein/PAS domain S-box-containing protein